MKETAKQTAIRFANELGLTRMTKHETREQWLRGAVEELRPWFGSRGLTIPREVWVSCGWPDHKVRTVRGEYFPPKRSKSGRHEIFISPILYDPTCAADSVLGTLVHELCHALDEGASGHRGAFKKAAKTVGLEGPAKSTWAGEGLCQEFVRIYGELGEYPHAGMLLREEQEKKGTTCRFLKAVCPTCGAIIRVTRKVVEGPGLPICAKDAVAFELEVADVEPDEPEED